jgi:hypothetical protein
METAITLAFLVTAFFSLFKFIEMRVFRSSDEIRSLKFFARDILFIFLATLIGSFILFHMHGTMHDFYTAITHAKVIHPSTTQIFTDAPVW